MRCQGDPLCSSSCTHSDPTCFHPVKLRAGLSQSRTAAAHPATHASTAPPPSSRSDRREPARALCGWRAGGLCCLQGGVGSVGRTARAAAKMTSTGETNRWSRGCGLGIGLSHHKNEYRLGVNVGNWTEDVTSVANNQTSPLEYPGLTLQATTTQRASYVPDGKYGPDAAEAGQRKDLELKYAGATRPAHPRMPLPASLSWPPLHHVDRHRSTKETLPADLTPLACAHWPWNICRRPQRYCSHRAWPR
mmetsp:Transcript_12958/g.32781  ORF Transcript_12958/g.32781 Transcript_12958/m.32781 type:complete len:248 (+) Transcript_12958:289-1032(+)